MAGGSGSRMGNTTPKQFLNLKGRPVVMHTIERFYHFDDSIHIVLVLPSDQEDLWEQLCNDHNFTIAHSIASGGTERYHSVKNGLELINGGLTAVHDAVRPLVSIDTIGRTFELAQSKGNAIPGVTETESLRKLDNDRNVSIDRSQIVKVQTPQVFETNLLKKAYERSYCTEFTDDASVCEADSMEINLCEGNNENIKLTTPIDLAIAEVYISKMNDLENE